MLDAVEVVHKMAGEEWGFTAKEAQTDLVHFIGLDWLDALRSSGPQVFCRWFTPFV